MSSVPAFDHDVAAIADSTARPASSPPLLPQSRAHCRAIVRSRAANFYYGMRLVSEPKRSATYALYAWLRQADDLADSDGFTTTEKLDHLERFWQDTTRTLRGRPLDDAACFWPAFREVVTRHQLPVATLREHLSGQLLDQRKFVYETFDELYDYCRRVASTVGVLCIDIWGYDGSARARQLAEWRGVALQLTNVLRDVREDAERGRVYLPRDGPDGPIEPSDLISCAADMRRVRGTRLPLASIHDVISKAREFYERSAPLEGLVHPDGRSGLWAMTQIYRGLLERIARRPQAVLSGRVSLPCWRKAVIALRAVSR